MILTYERHKQEVVADDFVFLMEFADSRSQSETPVLVESLEAWLLIVSIRKKVFQVYLQVMPAAGCQLFPVGKEVVS